MDRFLTSSCLLAQDVGGEAAGGGWLGWTAVDVPMLLVLPVLLVMSGFFSGSETALFGMGHAHRMAFRKAHPVAGRAVDALLADQRMLLITILLGNTTVNVMYFVTTSVLLMHTTAPAAVATVMALAFLLLIILAGEVGPKLLANTARVRVSMVCAPLLLTLHRLIGPLRVVLSVGVIGPLGRLTAPRHSPARLDDEELRALLDVSSQEGVIEPDEQQILHEVLAMRRLRVRDVMTPRVHMVALPTDASREDVLNLTREHRLTQIPIYAGHLDDIRGVLHVKRFVFEPSVQSVTDASVMTAPSFVPDVASLDQLLDHFRRTKSALAIVVDEYGGTEGIVAVEDVAEELVGDIIGADEEPTEALRLVGIGRWRAPGDLSVHDFVSAFGVTEEMPRVATLGGLVADRLGHAPVEGNVIEVDNLRVKVTAVVRRRVEYVEISLIMKPDGTDPSATDAGGEL